MSRFCYTFCYTLGMEDETQTTPTVPTSEEASEPEANLVVESAVPSPEPEPAVPESAPVVEPETIVESMTEPIEPTSETPATPTTETTNIETAQVGGNEPLPESNPVQLEPVQDEKTATKRDPIPAPRPAEKTVSEKEKLGLLRQMARATIQLRREKKLQKIMVVVAIQTAVTNDEVEKLLHVSDATATRYLSMLVARGSLKKVGHTGRGVRYEKK